MCFSVALCYFRSQVGHSRCNYLSSNWNQGWQLNQSVCEFFSLHFALDPFSVFINVLFGFLSCAWVALLKSHGKGESCTLCHASCQNIAKSRVLCPLNISALKLNKFLEFVELWYWYGWLHWKLMKFWFECIKWSHQTYSQWVRVCHFVAFHIAQRELLLYFDPSTDLVFKFCNPLQNPGLSLELHSLKSSSSFVLRPMYTSKKVLSSSFYSLPPSKDIPLS